MKHVEVVCAVIEDKDGNIFCCQRGPGRALEGKWEFPGGKIEDGETKEQSLIREIKEELSSEIEPIEYIGESYYEYLNMAPFKDFSIRMYAFKCKLISGNLELSEHTDAKWVKKNQLKELDFAAADYPLLEMIK